MGHVQSEKCKVSHDLTEKNKILFETIWKVLHQPV